jgi:hypothetical protein
MDTKLYLTVAAVVAILYALAFLLIPLQASLFFSDFPEPRLRFCGAAIFAWSLIVWFARNFKGRYEVRSVLIASVVGLAVNIGINVWATLQGWLNAKAWAPALSVLVSCTFRLAAVCPRSAGWKRCRCQGRLRSIPTYTLSKRTGNGARQFC